MNRYVIIASAAVTAMIVILFGASVKRVPGDRQGLHIYRDGTTKMYAPGNHLVRPFSGSFVLYPVGHVEFRFPADGSYRALMSEGSEASVALNLRLDIRPGSAASLHELVGPDFYQGLEKMVKEAIEIEMAGVTRPSGELPDGYATSVIADVTQSVSEAGITVLSHRFDGWKVSGAQLAVDERPLRKVIFLGVDGADWLVINGMIAKGLLPNFAALVREGATGQLRSIEPLLSPLLWTTMATGKLPEEHGILNFTVVDPETGQKVPINRLYRRVDAVWNMLSDYGRSVHIVGWLATFPAESINGVMVTDRLGYLAYADAKDTILKGSVSPAERLEEITGLVTSSTSVAYEEFRPFLRLSRESFLENRASPFDPKNPINNMIMLYASTRTYAQIATRLLEENQPDLLAVYFELVDATKHLFMHYAPPRRSDVDPSEFDMYRNAVSRAYVYQDSLLGEFMNHCDDNTVLIVASDHGFKSGDSRPKLRPEIWAGKAAFWHRVDGVICLYGKGIQKGATIEDASILDITPTILGLQGLPKPADMPGKMLEAVFEDDLVSQLNRTAVATLQRERDIDELALSTGDATTEEALKKLEALGYVTPENPDAHNNLGQRYQEQGKFLEAIEEFKKALAINPNFPGALNNLGVCYGKLGRYDEAERALEKAISLNPQDVHAMNNLAVMYLRLNRLEDAQRYAGRSVEVEPGYANGHVTLGSIYATMGRFQPAEAEFLKALEIDPANRGAQVNLQRVRSEMKTE